MGRVTIRKKYITYARKVAREDSTARIDGRSTYIKRYPGKNYRIIMVYVTKRQRALRDMFADANVLAKSDMTRWNRVRHWERYARKHKKRGAYRAAVSFYYKMMREHGEELHEVGKGASRELMENRGERAVMRWMSSAEYGRKRGEVDERVFRDGKIFFWVKYDDVEECRREMFRLAG